MCEITDYFDSDHENTVRFSFSIVRVTSKRDPDTAFINYIKDRIIFAYRPFKFYQNHFRPSATDDEIRNYVKEQIIPSDDFRLDRNVRQGDWGEILAALIVTYFQNLKVPINKLQWKFHKDKAVFGTDLIAFNKDGDIKDIHYYEIKTRQNPHQKEGNKKERHYVSVWAYKSLEKDANSPTSSIANFLELLYFEKNDFENAGKFTDIVRNPQNYKSYYEIFLIVEQKKFTEMILDALDEFPPILSPLNVTLVFVDGLKELVEKTWQDIEEVLVQKINGDRNE
jgi:hypothetical protein